MELSREVIWKPIEGFEGLYEVSSEGKVRSLNYRGIKGRIEELSLGISSTYPLVCLSKDGKPITRSVHKLVAETFIPNPQGLIWVNHLDEDKHNNRVSNLMWCTAAENANYGTRNKRISISKGSCVEAYDSHGKVIYQFSSTQEAQRRGFKSSSISSCCRGERKTHRGLCWRYV